MDGWTTRNPAKMSSSPQRKEKGIRKGRIAKVLADARASLKEPSRPFTPAHLDQRFTVNMDEEVMRNTNANAAAKGRGGDDENSGNANSNNGGADIWVNETYYDDAPSYDGYGLPNTHEDYHLNGSNNNNNNDNHATSRGMNRSLAANLRSSINSAGSLSNNDEYADFGDDRDNSMDYHSTNNTNSNSNSNNKTGESVQDQQAESFQLMLCDLNDGMLVIEKELDIYHNNKTSDKMNDEVLVQVIAGMTQPVDKLSKHIKTVGPPSMLKKLNAATQDQYKNADACFKRLALMLLDVLSVKEYEEQEFRRLEQENPLVGSMSSGQIEVMRITSRHLLRLHVSMLSKDVIGSPSIDAAKILLRAVKSMYLIHTKDQDNDGTDTDDSMSVSTSDESILRGANNYQFRADVFNLSEISNVRTKIDEIMLSGGIDLLLELLGQIWNRLSSDLEREYSAFSDARNRNSPSKNGDNTRGNQEASPSSDLQKSIRALEYIYSKRSLYFLLEAAFVASGIIRNYSNKSSHRKRLLHMGTIQNIFRGMVVTCDSMKLLYASNGGLSKINYFIEQVSTQLGRIMSQLIAAQRNFSLDGQGRAKILETGSLGALCNTMGLFKKQSEVVLSCVRVTAKLSLLEPFRAQINDKDLYLQYFVDIIRGEAEKCRSIMLEDAKEQGSSDLDEENEDEGWPSWYTWLLLSRVTFTLGNLTTSNGKNRYFVGVECSCLKPLIVLLQACAGTFTQLYRNQTSSAEKESGSGGKLSVEDEANTSFDANETSFDAPSVENEQEYDSSPDASPARAHASVQSGTNAIEAELTDATVKMLRLMANICIDETVGTRLAASLDAANMLNEFLSSCRSNHPKHEELLLNVVATCTNITYYACHSASASADKAQAKNFQKMNGVMIEMAANLSNSLFHANGEIVLETARALGNLTRVPDVLQSLSDSRGDEALILLLDHPSLEVVAAVAGTLINVSANAKSRTILYTNERAGHSLIGALRRASLANISTSLLICQVFHNLLSKIDSKSQEIITWKQELTDLEETLEELVDLAAEFSEDDNDKYANFFRVGKAVQKLLFEEESK